MQGSKGNEVDTGGSLGDGTDPTQITLSCQVLLVILIIAPEEWEELGFPFVTPYPVLGMEPRILCVLGKTSTTKLPFRKMGQTVRMTFPPTS